MAISLKDVLKGSTSLPPRLLVYGVQGIGKTTLAARAPSPIILPTEDGLDALKVVPDLKDTAHFPILRSFPEVMEALTALATDDHPYKTLVLDSLDWTEPLVWQEVVRQNPVTEKGKPVNSIEDFGFGKGYVAALSVWAEYLDALNYLRTERGMTIIQTAHAEVKRYDDPTTDAYDRYQIKLHKAANAKMLEWADAVLFANYRVGIKESEVGFNKKRARAVGAGERLLFTEERPAFIAKNRFSMPAELPLNWDALAANIPFFSGQ